MIEKLRTAFGYVLMAVLAYAALAAAVYVFGTATGGGGSSRPDEAGCVQAPYPYGDC